MEILRKYGVATNVYIPVIKRAVQDFAAGADWTPVAGDVKVSKDGGAAANITTLPVAIAMGNGAMWNFALSATEMQAAKITVTVVDAATKAVEDQAFLIGTYGNALAEHAVDLDDAVRAGLTALPNAAAGASGGLPTLDVGLRVKADLERWLAGTPDALSTGKVAADLKLWVAVAPNALVAGRVDANAGVVGDKAGYALTVAEKDDIVDRSWDEARSGHVAAGSFGQALQLVRNGTAQAGAAGSITLDAGASAVNDSYKDAIVFILGGTGAGQVRRISAYVGATKVASITPNWATSPDATSVFVVLPAVVYVSVSGAGALSRTIGVTVGGAPLEGASVWVATDALGTNIVAGPLTTSSLGVVTVLLDAGTFYVWVQKDGYTAIVGQSITIV